MQDASRHYKVWIEKTSKFHWPIDASTPMKRTPTKSTTTIGGADNFSDSGISEEYAFYEGPLLRLLFNQVRNMLNQPYEVNLATIAILSKLALLPHPYLHEILLSTEIPTSPGASTLFNVIQSLSVELLAEIPRRNDFSLKIRDTTKRFLSNPSLAKGNETDKKADETDSAFEAKFFVISEFLKELSAISFVKYHYGTE